MNKKIFLIFGVTFLIMSPPLILLASGPNIVDIAGGLTPEDVFGNVKDAVLRILWSISIGFVIIMFSLAGFKYLTAEGDSNKISEANKAVIWGLLGATVIVLAWSVVSIIGSCIYGGC